MASSGEMSTAGSFLYPGPALVKIWQFAGPACCCKASTLARGAGPQIASSNCESPWDPCTLPWQEWWPSLARSSLMAQLWVPASEQFLSLDKAWVAIHSNPSVINAPTPDGRALVVALRFGRRAIAELLRRSGALLSRRVADEVLYESAKRGGVASVELLLFDARGEPRSEPWASPNAVPVRHGGTALDVASAHGQTACAELIRRAGGRHSLHRAAELGLPADVACWLGEGGCADERDGSGATPLCLAARGAAGSDTSMPDRARRTAQCVSLLLDARATVDALPITQETPLLTAAALGNVDLCALLLQARANPSVRDRKGRNAWDKAANHEVRALLAASPFTAAGPAGFETRSQATGCAVGLGKVAVAAATRAHPAVAMGGPMLAGVHLGAINDAHPTSPTASSTPKQQVGAASGSAASPLHRTAARFPRKAHARRRAPQIQPSTAVSSRSLAEQVGYASAVQGQRIGVATPEIIAGPLQAAGGGGEMNLGWQAPALSQPALMWRSV